MKKILTAILAFLYLTTAMGATLHFHYCMGQLIGWGLIDHESKTCSVCGMQKTGPHNHRISSKKGCCNDEHRLIKNDKDQRIFPSSFQFVKVAVDVPIDLFGLTATSWPRSFAIGHPTANAPPGSPRNPIYLLYRNFRI